MKLTKGDLYENHDIYDEAAAKLHEDWRYLTDSQQKSLAFSNLEQLLEQAMQAWEADNANLSRTDAAIDGFLAVFGSLLPGAGIPALVKEARAKSADAALRALYHQARNDILVNRNTLNPEMTERLAVTEILVIIETIEKAAGL
jgi:hypothetical protein